MHKEREVGKITHPVVYNFVFQLIPVSVLCRVYPGIPTFSLPHIMHWPAGFLYWEFESIATSIKYKLLVIYLPKEYTSSRDTITLCTHSSTLNFQTSKTLISAFSFCSCCPFNLQPSIFTSYAWLNGHKNWIDTHTTPTCPPLLCRIAISPVTQFNTVVKHRSPPIVLSLFNKIGQRRWCMVHNFVHGNFPWFR